jgi:hypothetical protein
MTWDVRQRTKRMRQIHRDFLFLPHRHTNTETYYTSHHSPSLPTLVVKYTWTGPAAGRAKLGFTTILPYLDGKRYWNKLNVWKWDLRSFGVLRSIKWCFAQTFRTTYQSQLHGWRWDSIWPETFCGSTILRWVNSQKRTDHIYTVAEAWSHVRIHGTQYSCCQRSPIRNLVERKISWSAPRFFSVFLCKRNFSELR